MRAGRWQLNNDVLYNWDFTDTASWIVKQKKIMGIVLDIALLILLRLKEMY